MRDRPADGPASPDAPALRPAAEAQSGVDDHGGDHAHPRRRAILNVILLGQFVIIGSTAALNVALSGIQTTLAASRTEVQWIALAYQLGYAAVLVIGGRMGDVFGHRRLLLIGLAGVWAGAVAAAAAQSPAMLIAARLLMGVSGGMASPQALAFVQMLFPRDERPRAFAAFGMIGGISYLAGQTLSGLLIEADLCGLGWRNAMTVSIVLGAVAFVGAVRLVPGRAVERPHRLDLLGAALSTAMVVALLYPVIQGSRAGWSPAMVALAAASPLIAAWLFLHERRLTRSEGEPLIDLRMFALRDFGAGLIAAVAINTTSFAPFYLVTLSLQFGYGFGPLATALATTPAPVGAVLGSRLAARFAHRGPARGFACGAALLALGVALLLTVVHRSGDALAAAALVVPMAVIGTGTGVLSPTAMRLALSHVPRAMAGSASSILQTTQQFTSAISIALGGAMFFAMVHGHGHDGYFPALASTLTMLLGLAAAVALTGLGLRRRRVAAAA